MNDFEKEYYEDEGFWEGDMVQDAANMKRMEVTAVMIKDDVRNLADIGCGNGVFINYLSQNKPAIKLTGVDRSAAALKYVNAEKIEASIENLPSENKSFDCVSCLEVIEHLPEGIYQKALDELVRISKKYIIISVPNSEILEDSYNKCPSCKSIFNYEMHLRSFNEKILKQLLESRNYNCTEIKTTGRGVSYWGHKEYIKLFYPEQTFKWRSPICPICGFKSKHKIKEALIPTINPSQSSRSNSRKLISYLSAIPKIFWPKISNDYWIIAHYERND